MPTRFTRDIRTVPNLLTVSRILLMIAAVPIYLSVSRGAGIVIAVIAGVTDYLDGAIARATGQVTRLGEVLDQFSDICFEASALLIAVAQGFFSPFVLLIYLVREFWVTTIRRFMAGARINIPSSPWGKLKTNLIMWGFLPTFLSLAAVAPSLEPGLTYAGQGMVGLGLFFSYLSAFGYTRAFVVGYNGLPPASGRSE